MLVYIASEGNNFVTIERTVRVTVLRQAVAVPTLTQDSFVFSGESHAVSLCTQSPLFVVGGITAATNAGTYEVILTLADTRSLVWADGTDGAIVLSWAIARAQRTVENPTVIKGDYGIEIGDALVLVTTTEGGKLTLSEGFAGVIGLRTYTWNFVPYDTDNIVWYNTSGTIDIVVERQSLRIAAQRYFQMLFTGNPFNAANLIMAGNNQHTILGGTTIATYVGEYYMTLDLVDPYNFRWRPGSIVQFGMDESDTEGTIIIRWSIIPATPNPPATGRIIAQYFAGATAADVAPLDGWEWVDPTMELAAPGHIRRFLARYTSGGNPNFVTIYRNIIIESTL